MFPSLNEDKYQRMLQTLFDTMKSNIPEPEPEQPVAAPVRDPGPFSSLINYDDEKQRQEERFAVRQRQDEKIARGNSIVDAFRLITQGIGGSFGASIPKEAPNASIIKSFDDYRAMDREKKDALERWHMFDLQNKVRDIQYGHAVDAREDTQAHQKEIANIAYERSQQDKEQERAFKAAEAEKERQARQSEAEKARQSNLEQIGARGKTAMEMEKFRKEQGYYPYQNRTTVRRTYDTLDPQLQLQIQDALVNLHRSRLEKGEIDMLPDAIRAIEENEPLKAESMDQLMLDAKGYLRANVPGYAEAYPQLMQQQQGAATPGEAPEEQGDEPAIPDIQLVQHIANVMNNTAYSDAKKKRLMVDLLMSARPMTRAEARKAADGYFAQFQQGKQSVMNKN